MNISDCFRHKTLEYQDDSCSPPSAHEDLSTTNCWVLRVAPIPAPNARSEQPHAVCNAWVRIESAMTTYTSVITYFSSQVASTTLAWASGPNGQSHSGLTVKLQVWCSDTMQTHTMIIICPVLSGNQTCSKFLLAQTASGRAGVRLNRY